jgi:predicted FMN-binding regulatory protein PaiB
VRDDPDWLRHHVGELTDQQERDAAQPWAVSDAPDRYIDVMLRGIVGFRFVITRLEGKWKMSQNREMADREGVVQGLVQRAAGDDLEIAAYVERQIKPGALGLFRRDDDLGLGHQRA